MTWSEAIAAMRDDKLIRHKSWADGFYIYIHENRIKVSHDYADFLKYAAPKIVNEVTDILDDTASTHWEVIE